MIQKDRMPERYRPYETLLFCSNTIRGGGHLFELAGAFPLLIGQGHPPLVWLKASSGPGAESLFPVVEASKATHPKFAVVEAFGGTVILSGMQKVLSVRATGGHSAEVDFLDLRPAGYNIHGDPTSLYIGGNKFSGNSISGGGVFFRIG